jgi:hypothetical protein
LNEDEQTDPGCHAADTTRKSGRRPNHLRDEIEELTTMRNGHKTALRPMPVPPAEDHDGDNDLRRTHAGASTTHLKACLAEAGENTAAILKVVEALD